MLTYSHPDRGFQPPAVCGESGTADCKQSRRLLECTEYNFQVLVLDKPTREAVSATAPGAHSADKLVRKMILEAASAVSDHALVKSLISRNMSLEKRLSQN